MAMETVYTRQIPLAYNAADSYMRAIKLMYGVYPPWEIDLDPIIMLRFTEGITDPGRHPLERASQLSY